MAINYVDSSEGLLNGFGKRALDAAVAGLGAVAPDLEVRWDMLRQGRLVAVNGEGAPVYMHVTYSFVDQMPEGLLFEQLAGDELAQRAIAARNYLVEQGFGDEAMEHMQMNMLVLASEDAVPDPTPSLMSVVFDEDLNSTPELESRRKVEAPVAAYLKEQWEQNGFIPVDKPIPGIAMDYDELR